MKKTRKLRLNIAKRTITQLHAAGIIAGYKTSGSPSCLYSRAAEFCKPKQ